MTIQQVPPFWPGPATDYKTTDWMEYDGARKLATMIEKAWADVGATVIVEVYECRERGRAAFAIRSNLVNGLPPS